MKLTLHEFDNFDPKYTIDRLGLIPGDENNWKHIVKDVNYLYEYGMGLKTKDNEIHSTYRKKKVLEEWLYKGGFIDYK